MCWAKHLLPNDEFISQIIYFTLSSAMSEVRSACTSDHTQLCSKHVENL
jgi:hypothetical protein